MKLEADRAVDLSAQLAPDAGAEAPPERRLGSARPIVVSLVLAAGFAWLLASGGLPVVPARGAFAEVAPWAVPGYLGVLVGSHLLRAARWRHLLRPLGGASLRAVLASSWIGFAAAMFLPLRTGELVRPLLIARRSRVRAWEAAGAVGAERVVDGLAVSLLLFVALSLTTPRHPPAERVGDLAVPVAAVPGAAYSAVLLFAACALALVLVYAKRDLGRRLAELALGWISPRAAARFGEALGRTANGLSFLPAPTLLLPFLLETVLYWASNAVGLYVLARGCGLGSIGLAEASVVLGCLSIGIVLPAGPGYFGAFQLSAYVGLALYVAADRVAGPGSAFVFLAYVCQITQHLTGALAGALLDRLPERRDVTSPAGSDSIAIRPGER
jgi:uncharacterized protein (TIRG00374 family)